MNDQPIADSTDLLAERPADTLSDRELWWFSNFGTTRESVIAKRTRFHRARARGGLPPLPYPSKEMPR